jgi:hypothetical protein
MANVFGAVSPYLLTLSFLNVSIPLALISGSIGMDVNTEAMCLIHFELTDVDITSAVPEGTFPMRFVIAPFAFINRS